MQIEQVPGGRLRRHMAFDLLTAIIPRGVVSRRRERGRERKRASLLIYSFLVLDQKEKAKKRTQRCSPVEKKLIFGMYVSCLLPRWKSRSVANRILIRLSISLNVANCRVSQGARPDSGRGPTTFLKSPQIFVYSHGAWCSLRSPIIYALCAATGLQVQVRLNPNTVRDP